MHVFMLFISLKNIILLKNNSKNSKTNQLILIEIALNVCIIYIICHKDLFSDPVLLCPSSCITISLFCSLIVFIVKLQLENE